MNFIDAVHSHLCHRVTYLSALLWKVEAGGEMHHVRIAGPLFLLAPLHILNK